ncbi:hypothetical protein [Micromonospora sp. NPDC023888]|uniref:hypothetical protein n=1 Tax=Micromonospora sp. NPDC023888 TaxID=3155607 RepID=UPI0033CC2993
MTPDPARELVRRTVSGHLVTAVFQTAAGVLWLRSPGPWRTSEFRTVPADTATALRALSGRHLDLVVGEPLGGGLLYRVPSSRPCLDLLSSMPTAAQWTRIAETLTVVGRGLRALHGLSPGGPHARPLGAQRLATWLRGGPQSCVSDRLARVWHARLGARRTARVLDWCDELDAAGPRDVLLQGGVSIGSLVDGAGGPPALLCGEEIATGRPEYDLGWLCGELLEWQLAVGDIADVAAVEAARQAVLRGYGDGIDLDLIQRVMVLRIATHAHDFAAYVRWIDSLATQLDTVADLVDRHS